MSCPLDPRVPQLSEFEAFLRPQPAGDTVRVPCERGKRMVGLVGSPWDRAASESVSHSILAL